MRAVDTPTFTCTTCEGRIPGDPVFHLGLAFCCAGCAADGPCTCSYDPPGAARLHHSRHDPAVAIGEWTDEPDEPGIPVNLPLRPASVPGGGQAVEPKRAGSRARSTLIPS
jgi:hypothetical protein